MSTEVQGPLDCNQQTTLSTQQPVTCIPDMHQWHWFSQLCLNVIPFFGPSIAALLPSPLSKSQISLQNAQEALTNAQCELKKIATTGLGTLTQNICELEVTLFGDDSTCGYVQLALLQISVPLQQRAILISINVAFLAIILISLVLLI